MLIAIHVNNGSFSDRWVEKCESMGLAYVMVNALDSDIISQLSNADCLLWHWTHVEPVSLDFARSIIAAVERLGVVVFPSIDTCWHYDDKIAQKYVLEAIGAALVPTFVSHSEVQAREWVSTAKFPKVFKLRRGAGSQNVKLVQSPADAGRLIRTAFSDGFSPTKRVFGDLKAKAARHRAGKDYWSAIRRIPSTFRKLKKLKRAMPRERGYVYFQDFLPDNAFDTRVTVIGSRAFCFRRYVREKDFRASGSGKIDYDPNQIDKRAIHHAFEVTQRLSAQSLAFDFVLDALGQPKIVEISYCYLPEAVYACPGYWDPDLRWHEGSVWPQDAILDDMLVNLEAGKRAAS